MLRPGPGALRPAVTTRSRCGISVLPTGSSAKLRYVAIDRPLALRNGEKLLRQGKLDAAIAEYLRVVEDQPQDWNTANVLGDLYLRAGQSDKAVEQFARIADNLSSEGFWPKAAALYKKIIKIRPDDEHALMQAGEMAAGRACWSMPAPI